MPLKFFKRVQLQPMNSSIRTIAALLIASSAAAFAPARIHRASTATFAGIDDLKALAEKANPVLKVSYF
jgi:hypothetical protein